MPTPQHPIVDVAIRALAEDGWGGLILEPAGRDALARELTTYFERPDLADAVRELMVFALYVGEQEEARATALQLLDVAALATPALERRALLGREDLLKARKRAAELLGNTTVVPRAPSVGAAKPAGSVSIASILSGLPGRRRG